MFAKPLFSSILIYYLDLRNGWQIISPTKSFTVYAATANEKSEWMTHIKKCVHELITKRKIFRGSTSVSAHLGEIAKE